MEIVEAKKKIKVEVVSDIACPWCYIGKKRLEKAIEESKHKFDFEVIFQPFQLDPRIPLAGFDYKEHLSKKFGSLERMQEIFHRVESVGSQTGINFRFFDIPKAINTLPLHQLLHIALEDGNQLEVASTLFDAYMVNPEDLSDYKILVKLMEKHGWKEERTMDVLNDETLRGVVENRIDYYHQMGISGVPFFIINSKYAISGAQPSETFISAFKSLKPEDFPQDNVTCSIDGC